MRECDVDDGAQDRSGSIVHLSSLIKWVPIFIHFIFDLLHIKQNANEIPAK